MFTRHRFEQELLTKLDRLWTQGTNGRKSYNLALGRARKVLEARGYSTIEASYVVEDIRNIHGLIILSREG